MKIYNLLTNLPKISVAYYGVPAPEQKITDMPGVIIAISAVAVGVVAGIIILLKHAFKKKPEQAQGLYGPPKMFEPPQDLYGCPRPDEPEEITEENSKEN